MGHRSGPSRATERAATLVEYVLLIAVLALGTLAGIAALEDGAERVSTNTAAKISTRTVPSVPTASGGGGGGGGGSTTSTVPATTTTQAPTVSARWGATTTQTRSGEWKALASLKVTDGSGKAVGGAAVVVKVEYRTWLGWGAGGNVSATTGSDGVVSVDSGWYPTGGWFPIDELRVTVVSVAKPGATWDGVQPSASVPR